MVYREVLVEFVFYMMLNGVDQHTWWLYPLCATHGCSTWYMV